MAEQKILLGNVRGEQGPAGPNKVSSETTTSGFEDGHVLYNNNGKVGAKKLTASDVSALPDTGTAEKAKKLQLLNREGAPYEWNLFGKYSDKIGGFVLGTSDNEESGTHWPVSAGKLQCKDSDGNYYDWSIDSSLDESLFKFVLYGSSTGSDPVGVLVESARHVIQSSSIRYKEDVREINEEILNAFLALDVIDFIYKETAPENARDGKRHYGMIAEQVVKVMPDSVTLDREGLPTAVVYSDFIPLLLAQLQRQQKKLSALEQRIQKLEEGNKE